MREFLSDKIRFATSLGDRACVLATQPSTGSGVWNGEDLIMILQPANLSSTLRAAALRTVINVLPIHL